MPCCHDLHPSHAPKEIRTTLVWAIVLNAVFVVAQVFYGFKAHSLALLADAGHNFGDVLALILAAVAVWLSLSRPNKAYSYGLQSTTILAALSNALLMLLAFFEITREAVERLLVPPTAIPDNHLMIVVAAVGVVVNGLTVVMLHKSQTIHSHALNAQNPDAAGGEPHEHSGVENFENENSTQETSNKKLFSFPFFRASRQRPAAATPKDLNIHGMVVHLFSDALVSVGVVVGAVLMGATGWAWLDPVIGLMIAAFILWSTWGLLRRALRLALQGVPTEVQAKEVEEFLRTRAGVADVHDLHIWALGTRQNALSAHLLMPKGHPGDAFIEAAAQGLKGLGIQHATLQIEVGDGKKCEGCEGYCDK